MITIRMTDGSQIPLRGDLIYTALADRRGARTRIVIHSHRLPSKNGIERARIWAVQWWFIEPETRQALARSAERRPGGQRSIPLVWDKRAPKKRRTFEQLMGAQ